MGAITLAHQPKGFNDGPTLLGRSYRPGPYYREPRCVA